MYFVFGKSLDFQNGEYGIAILSRFPLDSVEVVSITPPADSLSETFRRAEPRRALSVLVRTPWKMLRVINTHLDYHPSDSLRVIEMHRLLTYENSLFQRPTLLVGDFNDTPASRTLELTRPKWKNAGPKFSQLTFPSDTPEKRIDYILVHGTLKPVKAEIIGEQISDHLGVLVEFEVTTE
jgi:endonuclease/exonuclease/phosphatase family metal-dependent hydrolase